MKTKPIIVPLNIGGDLSCMCVKIAKKKKSFSLSSIDLGNYLLRNEAKTFRLVQSIYIILFSY